MSTFSKITGDEPEYTQLEKAHLMEDAGSEADTSLHRRNARVARLGTQVPWALSAVLLVLLGASWAFKWSSQCGASSFERGFDTELEPAKPHIQMQKVRYRGTPIFGDDGEEYVEYLPGEKRYVGEPSDEIDEAWNELTKRRFFLLSETEAKTQFGSKYTRYWNEGWGGLDIFHTLHCLDHIRKSLYPDHYHQSSLHGKIHNGNNSSFSSPNTGHCIDHIRQQIMCQGDLTPLPSQYFESKGMNYLDSDREHTCRDFSRIRQWTHLRYNQSLTGDEVWTGHYKPGHEGTSSFGPV
ncbi:MAG: hypothetical protein Q9206_004002 [Seirophora lacunosa]